MAGALSALQGVVTTADILRRSINDCFTVSGKLRVFYDQLGVLGCLQKDWKDQITKFGLSEDEDLLRIIRKAQATLDEEKARLFGKNDDGGALFSSKITCWLFPARLESSIQKVTTFCKELNNFNLTREKQFEELARDRALQRASSFLFRPDSRYIPLEETEEKVKRALTNSGDPSIILLHGPSGTGKSALARNLALHFQMESKEKGGNSQTSKPSNATFEKVVFLECGPEVTLEAKQREIAEKLDPSSNNFDATDVNSAGKARFNVKLLSALLRESSLLIILDDIWQTKSESAAERPSFLRGLMYDGGKRVKWLITSQSKHICDRVNLGDLCILSMERVKLADARRILVSLTNLQESDITELQDVMDQIINKTGTNLLALACVASSMSDERKTEKEEWKRLEMDLFKALEKEAAIGIQSIDYGRSYWGAIRFGFDRLTLPQKYLLNLIQLCSSTSVPSGVIEYLFHHTQQQSWREGFANARNELEDKQLLTIQRITDSYFGKKESWSIHDLLRGFIRQEYSGSLDDSMIVSFIIGKDHINITQGPTSKLEIDVLIHVAHLYFDEHYRRQLVSKMGFLSKVSHLVDLRREIIGPITRLLMHVDDVQLGDERSASSLRSSILQVFLKYAQDGIFDEMQTSNLLNSLESQVPMVEALYNSAMRSYHPVIGKQIMDILLSLLDRHTPLVVEPLSKHLSARGSNLPPNLPTRISYVFAVSLINSENERRATYLASASLQAVLEKLTVGLVGVNEVNKPCASILRSLGCGHDDIKLKIVDYTGILQSLVTLIRREDSPALQEEAIRVVWNLAAGGDDIRLKTVDFPGLLQTLVTVMRRDDSPTLQEAATRVFWNLAAGDNFIKVKILDFPGLLPTLVTVMRRDDSPTLQEAATRVFCNLAAGDNFIKVKILDFPGLLPSLVTVMRRDAFPTLQEAATRVVWNLAVGSDDIKLKTTDFPELLQTLVTIMGSDDFPALQEAATQVVRNLANGSYNMQVKVIDFPGLLQTLVKVMGRGDSPALQEAATQVVRNLANGGEYIKVKIIDYAGLLQSLVTIIRMDDSPALQEAATRVVWNLTAGGDDIKLKTTDFPELLQTLVTIMGSDDFPALQEAATQVVRNLANGSYNMQAKVIDFPGLLPTLVKVMGRGDSPALQEAATQVVRNLAAGDNFIKVKILDFPGLLPSLVTVMRRDAFPTLQEAATRVVWNLAVGSDDIKLKTTDFPELLQTLVTIMGSDDFPALQDAATQVVRNLANGSYNMQVKVIDFPGLLQTLVKVMGRGDSPALQEAATQVVRNLANGGEYIKVKIIDYAGLLQSLVTIIRMDDSPALQEAATRVVWNLTAGGDDIKVKTIDFPGLLQALVKVMGRGDSPALQEAASQSVRNLANGGEYFKVKIIDYAGLLQSLVTIIRMDNSPALQEAATRVVWNLTAGGDDIKVKILDFPGLLQSLMKAMRRDGSPGLQEAATNTIRSLAAGDDDIKLKTVDFPGLLQTLVTVLGTGDSPALQNAATYAVWNLAKGGDDVKVKILNFPGLLQTLVTVMQRDDSLAVQKQAAQGVDNPDNGVKRKCGRALASMAIGGDAVLRKMVVNFPEMVDVLIDAMGKSNRFDTDLGDGMLVLTLLSPVRAKETQLDSVVAYLGRGRGELRLGHYKECLEDFGRYLASLSGPLEENPNAKYVRRLIHTWSCYAKAKLENFQGAFADADILVQMEIGMDGEAFALQERGVVKRMMGDLPGALADLNASLGLEDDDYELLKHRGFVKFLLNDEEGARADGERAVKCKPSRVDQSNYGKDFLGGTSVQYLNFELR